jgi:guanylate kinase
VVSGPSGVGKGTVIRSLLPAHPDLYLSISVTTRPPRADERDGVEYLFVPDAEFDRMIEAGEFLEWAPVVGHRSGTPAATLMREMDRGRRCVLEIDVQGARQVRQRVPEAILIFLAPPSMEELERRLRGRGTEDEQRIRRRMETAAREMEQMSWFDHVVVNDDVERASAQAGAIIAGSHPRPQPDAGRSSSA